MTGLDFSIYPRKIWVVLKRTGMFPLEYMNIFKLSQLSISDFGADCFKNLLTYKLIRSTSTNRIDSVEGSCDESFAVICLRDQFDFIS